MNPELLVPIVAVFLSVALGCWAVFSLVLSNSAPERRRLRELGAPSVSGLELEAPQLTEIPSPRLKRLASLVPKSPKEMNRLRRRLATGGYRSLGAAVAYSIAELVLPVVAGALTLYFVGWSRGVVLAVLAAIVAYMLPTFWLGRKIERRKRQIRNGLPDALDLILLCLEAGSSIDQAVVKTSSELAITWPALAEELRLITIETRAGKPRMEAFRNFADRTKVDDVRAFVAMLTQTDRFGTSLGQALRTHAETSRTKRRQRAEEKAGKLGVKLVFPLVFLLFPAFYVVVLGPTVIKFARFFMASSGSLVGK
jgi:tight adherence protein C